MNNVKEIATSDLTNQISRLSISETLHLLTGLYPGAVTFSTSFSIEDQIITHHIASENLPVNIFTLDTGRLFAETYSVWSSTIGKYPVSIKSYSPDFHLLEPFVRGKGPNAFYESVENRKECCYIRKVEPLKRALSGQQVWITGIRAEHSGNRSQLS
ncbi:MAG TPA: phosphoadenosine phosphosulfate reductase family protein, partial [Puia sp.]|nr:phosphoadenosine phosphosulfate reductase family protein [Puia sp.]